MSASESSSNFVSPPPINDADTSNRNMYPSSLEYKIAFENSKSNANGKTELQFSPGILDAVSMGFNQVLNTLISGFSNQAAWARGVRIIIIVGGILLLVVLTL